MLQINQPNTIPQASYCAFAGSQRIASGALSAVARRAMEILSQETDMALLVFDDATGKPIEIDWRGTPDDVASRLEQTADHEAATQPGPGRPKLGVVAREVTLLPRHWDWLNSQPGGASVALRKLVEEAKRANSGKDAIRQSQEASYQFMAVMAGDRPGFEEATRALFAGNGERFSAMTDSWPADIRDYARKLADAALGNQ